MIEELIADSASPTISPPAVGTLATRRRRTSPRSARRGGRRELLVFVVSCFASLGGLVRVVVAAPEDEADARRPGLELTFASGAVSDGRISRLVAIDVPAGVPPTPFLPPGPFEARFEGFLEIEFFDDYTFAVEGRGAMRVEIDGEVVLEAGMSERLDEVEPRTVELEEGPRRVVVHYESPVDGDARLRLEWSSFDFARGPIPAALLSRPARVSSPAVERGLEVRRGRDLFARRLCRSCHEIGAGSEEGYPELGHRAPSLVGVGSRVRERWLEAWVLDPPGQRPEAHMPRVLGEGEGAAESARDIAAWLASLREGEDAAHEAGEADRGAELFVEIGCRGCHVLGAGDRESESPGGREDDRVSLTHVSAKWRDAALVRFLLDPYRHRPSSRMPDLGLDDDEARHLAAHLVRATSPADGARPEEPATRASDPGRVAKGRSAAIRRGCLRCHGDPEDGRPGDGEEAELRAPRLDTPRESASGEHFDAWLAGCLSTDVGERDVAPDYEFSDDDRRAIARFLAEGRESIGRVAPPEYAERVIDSLRCRACHVRDGVPDIASSLDAADDGSEPPGSLRASTSGGVDGGGEFTQERPPLTWTGDKLRPEWLTAFLRAPRAMRVRPWLRARMPRFALDASRFADGVAAGHAAGRDRGPADGRSGEDESRRSPDAATLAAGVRLVAADGGLACVTCHALDGAEPTGAFDARGPDLALAPRRLREGFFLRWLRDPQSVRPGTKMPSFAPDGRSPVLDVLDGDATRQFRAIWDHLRTFTGDGAGNGTPRGEESEE